MDSFDAGTEASEVLAKLGQNSKGKTYMITGTSHGGLGAAVATYLASAGAGHLILAARTKSKVDPVIEKIQSESPNTKITFINIDLLDNSTIHTAVLKIKFSTSKIDVLVNNAGVMATRQFILSKDGVESQFAANYLGHFLLTNLLLKAGLVCGPDSLIVNVGSLGYQLSEINFEDLNYDNGKTYKGWPAYGQAKTANILHAYALGNRLKGKTPVIVVHPGVMIESNLLSNSAIDQEYFGEAYALAMERHKGNLPPQTTVSMSVGAATVLAAILDDSIRRDAPFFLVENNKQEPWEYAVKEENQQKLWNISAKLVGEQYSI